MLKRFICVNVTFIAKFYVGKLFTCKSFPNLSKCACQQFKILGLCPKTQQALMVSNFASKIRLQRPLIFAVLKGLT
jgi:hypothetical protein